MHNKNRIGNIHGGLQDNSIRAISCLSRLGCQKLNYLLCISVKHIFTNDLTFSNFSPSASSQSQMYFCKSHAVLFVIVQCFNHSEDYF